MNGAEISMQDSSSFTLGTLVGRHTGLHTVVDQQRIIGASTGESLSYVAATVTCCVQGYLFPKGPRYYYGGYFPKS